MREEVKKGYENADYEGAMVSIIVMLFYSAKNS